MALFFPKYLVLIVAVLLLFIIAGCSGEEEVNTQASAGATEQSEDQRTGGSAREAHASRTVPTSFFQEGYCPLTPEIVQEYCGITGSVARGEYPPCSVASDGFMISSFSVYPLQEMYADYGVSNLRDFINADFDDARAGEEFCPLTFFEVDLADETIATNAYEAKSSSASCVDSRATNANNLRYFEMFARGGNFLAFFSGRDFSEGGCTVDETKNLANFLLFGEEPVIEEVVEVVEEIEVPEMETVDQSGTCAKVCKGIKPILENLLQGSYQGYGASRDYKCEFRGFTPNSGESVSYRNLEVNIYWTANKGILNESCQLKDVKWTVNPSWEEFKAHFNGVTEFDHVITPEIHGVENYFYHPVGISYGSFDTYFSARLFFQSPIDGGVYEISFWDGERLTASPEDDIQRRINRLAEIANAIIPIIVNENAERVIPYYHGGKEAGYT